MTYFFISSIVLNQSWLLTSVAIVTNLVGALVFFTVFFGIHDIGFLIQLIAISGTVIWCLWRNEYSMKLEIIRLNQIEKMSEDLKNLLIEMPKPLVLLDESTNEVVLANKELCHLISIPDHSDTKSISEQLK